MQNNNTTNNQVENDFATETPQQQPTKATTNQNNNDGKAEPRETPYTLMKQIGSGKVSDEEMLKKLIEYNRNLVSLPGCKTFDNNKRKAYTSCTCLKDLMASATNEDNDLYFRVIATFQIYFGKMKKREQQFKVMDWVRYAHCGKILENGQQRYFIPYMIPEGEEDDDDDNDDSDNEGDGGDDDDDSMPDKVAPKQQNRRINELNILQNHKICRNALMSILGIGYKWWRTVVDCVENHKSPPRGTDYGRVRAKRKKFVEQEDELKEFFEYLKGEAKAVPTETDGGQKGEKVYYLGSKWTKHHCYKLYCVRRGTTDHSGNGTITENTEDASGVEAKSCMGRSSFQRYWRAEHPELRIGSDNTVKKKPPRKQARTPRQAKPGLGKKQQFIRYEEPELRIFFEELRQKVRNAKGKNAIQPFGLKKRCFEQYCALRGKTCRDLGSNTLKLEDIPGVVPKSCISWTTFRRYWAAHYPDIVV